VSEAQEVEIVREGPNKISITFPEGTKARIMRRMPVDKLLEALTPPADVEGQSEESPIDGITLFNNIG
jgi:hypothetical protein